jgi:hypothetical protein
MTMWGDAGFCWQAEGSDDGFWDGKFMMRVELKCYRM